MTDHYVLVGNIRAALTGITDHYDMALIPATRPPMKLPTKPSPDAKIKYAPKGMKEAPAPTSLHALDARLETSRDLRYWVGFIYDEIRDHNGDHIRTLIDGDNIPAMCAHINRWADHIVSEFPDDADNLHDDLRGHASKLRALAYPDRRSYVTLGACPIDIDSPDGPVKCAGQVRSIEDKNGDVEDAQCRKCGTVAVIKWWENAIMPDASTLVTGSELPEFIREQFGKVILEPTLRKWIERGVIESAGQDAKGRTLYDKGAVAYALARRELRHA